jgi:hypothetical protein
MQVAIGSTGRYTLKNGLQREVVFSKAPEGTTPTPQWIKNKIGADSVLYAQV